MNRKVILDEIEELSPTLAALKTNKLQYDIPSDYFHGLPDELWKRVNLQLAAKQSKIKTLLPYAAAAASVALLFYMYGVRQDYKKDTYSAIYYNYVMDNIDDFDEEHLIELGLTDVGYDELPVQITEEDVNQFLIDEN